VSKAFNFQEDLNLNLKRRSEKSNLEKFDNNLLTQRFNTMSTKIFKAFFD